MSLVPFDRPDPGTRAFRRAVIEDDHPLFCDALSMTLKAVVGIEAIESCDHLEVALGRLHAGDPPDIVVLDLNLPDVSGLDGLLRVRTAVPGVPVVIVSAMADPRMIAAAIRAGAAGFAPKHSGREVFRAAFQAIREGRIFVPDAWCCTRRRTGPRPTGSTRCSGCRSCPRSRRASCG